MKKIIALVMLVTATGLTSIAQEENPGSKTDKTFGLPANSIKRRYMVDLGRGNKMQLELTDMDGLNHLANIDSLVALYLQDIKPFKDSLSDELSSKRIDYLVDPKGKNKIRIQVCKQKGSSFLVKDGDVSALKLEQDTIHIIIPLSYASAQKPSVVLTHLFRVSFFLNEASDLAAYTEGRITEKITALQKTQGARWVKSGDSLWIVKGSDRSISARQPGGYVSSAGDYLNLYAGVNIQNYKNYFVPSFNVGAKVVFNSKMYKQELGLSWEPHFFFAKNSLGNLQTYRNDFLTLLLSREPVRPREKDGMPHFNFLQQLSVGYLVNRKGDFFDNHSFRLGTGGITWYEEKIKLEPIMYFHDFFKGVTPGLRLSLGF